MKTLKQNLLKSVLFIFILSSAIVVNARTSSFGNSPVKPEAFTAVFNNNNRVDLKWSTETETNLSHFIVERSLDGINFSDAALVFAYGNTTARSDYAFADNISKVRSTTVYYRVSAIGTDGKNQHSDIVVIRTDK
jgi:hypothetical protein